MTYSFYEEYANNAVWITMILVGIIIFLLALILPYPSYVTIPQQCFATGHPAPCTLAYHTWVWQRPLIVQIYNGNEGMKNPSGEETPPSAPQSATPY